MVSLLRLCVIGHSVHRVSGDMQLVMLIIAVALGAGCTSSPGPDLAWMYTPGREVSQPPLVIIPGMMGTRLVERDTGREVWPGSTWRVMLHDYRSLALPLVEDQARGPALIHGGLTDRVAGRDFYRSITETLESAAGYRRVELGHTPQATLRNYYVFTYDWRQDLQQTAARLHEFIEAIRRDRGDPSLEVDVVAHSMGGLILRYFIRYGAEDVLEANDLEPTMAGAAMVRRGILLGTPNLGSVEAIRAMIGGRRVGLQTIAPETLASMPSMYQLFPHAVLDWLVTNEGKSLSRDQFDVRVWQRFQWSVFDPVVASRLATSSPEWTQEYQPKLVAAFESRLERARRFVWSLTVAVPSSVPLIVFGGDCRYTPARLVVEEIEGESVVRLWPDQVRNRVSGIDYRRLMLEPGDGIVTKASLLARVAVDPTVPRHHYTHFPLDYAFMLCERHDRLAGNPSFQDNLLDALLRPLSEVNGGALL